MLKSGIAVHGLVLTVIANVFMMAVSLIGGNNVVAGGSITMDMGQVSAQEWNTLNQKRIFFGHQSVGYNILDGIEMVKEQNPAIKLKVLKLNSPDELDASNKGILFHAEMGSNFDPRSKIDDFASWMNNGIGGNVDVAFMKFCFVDIGTQTDLVALFNYYKRTMANLKAKYPATTIVHVTVPLLSEQTGLAKWKHKLKGIVKKVLGKNEFYENVDKFTYNEMIRAEYLGKEPIFDLAAAESTFPDGSRLTFPSSGKNIECMVPAYTNDGGHLDSEGQKIVAENMLSFLASLD